MCNASIGLRFTIRVHRERFRKGYLSTATLDCMDTNSDEFNGMVDHAFREALNSPEGVACVRRIIRGNADNGTP